MVTRQLGFALAAVLATAAAAHDHGAASPRPDMARMWQERIEKAPHLAVAATFGDDGRLWLARVVGGHVVISHAAEGAAFSEPVVVNAVAEPISADGEARPRIAVVGRRVHVSWTSPLPQPFAGHIRHAVSTDGGRHFAEPATVNDDRQPITHRFNAMLADAEGVTIAWIDKRDAVGQAGYRGAAIYTARSADAGRSFAPNRKLADHGCECCRLALAADRDGTPVVLWRHIFGANVRDFALARLGEPLRRASEDGWAIDACPHHGGALAIDRHGGRHLAWFTGADQSPGLHYRRIDGERMTPPLPFGDPGAQAGHPAVAVDGDRVVLAWRQYDGRQNRILAMRSPDRGDTWGAPVVLAASVGATDDPLLLVGRGAIWLAWHTADQGVRLIEAGQ